MLKKSPTWTGMAQEPGNALKSQNKTSNSLVLFFCLGTEIKLFQQEKKQTIKKYRVASTTAARRPFTSISPVVTESFGVDISRSQTRIYTWFVKSIVAPAFTQGELLWKTHLWTCKTVLAAHIIKSSPNL